MAWPGATNFYHQFSSNFPRLSGKYKWKYGGNTIMGFSVANLFQNPDQVDNEIKTAKIMQFREQTGNDRLKNMFSYDQYGNFSPEIQNVIQGGMMGIFTGTIMGGTASSRKSYVEFMEKNQATAFQNTFEAKKHLQDKVTLGFARGAWMMGWRLGLFCGSYMLLTTTIAVYRGKSGIIEYITAGGVTGFVYKFKQGPKAALSGGIIGSALGAIAGSATLAIMYMTGTSMEEIRYWQYQWKEEKEEKILQQMREVRQKDLDSLETMHQQIIEPSKDTIINDKKDAEKIIDVKTDGEKINDTKKDEKINDVKKD